MYGYADQSLGHVRYARSRLGHPRFWSVTRIIQTELAAIPFAIAGIVRFSMLPPLSGYLHELGGRHFLELELA